MKFLLYCAPVLVHSVHQNRIIVVYIHACFNIATFYIFFNEYGKIKPRIAVGHRSLAALNREPRLKLRKSSICKQSWKLFLENNRNVLIRLITITRSVAVEVIGVIIVVQYDSISYSTTRWSITETIG